MGVTYSPRPVPPTASKKMQPLSNIGSEPVETSRKSKSSKIAVTAENVARNTKAQDVLAKRKADAAKATLPSLAKKSTKLLKVNETLARRKAEAAKVAAAKREKKKVHDPSPTADAEKRGFQRRGLQMPQKGEGTLQLRRKVPMMRSPLEKRHGLIRSRRRMKTLTFCRRLRFNLVHLILRRGLCGK
jgi:hypothetical protein